MRGQNDDKNKNIFISISIFIITAVLKKYGNKFGDNMA